MKSVALITLLFSGAFGSPVHSQNSWSSAGLKIRNTGDQGDGLYLAVFDDNGHATVEFTPFSDMNMTIPDAGDESKVADTESEAPANRLSKRNGITCSGRNGNTAIMDPANRQLASNADGHGQYGRNAWGWVFSGDYVSYFCCYTSQYLAYSKIIEYHTSVSGKCGQSGYGFKRQGNGPLDGGDDTAVGRTFKGDHFCNNSFNGGI
ncbi:hypothetical protein ACLX1H_008862 [Fusarium chlamydosporum]